MTDATDTGSPAGADTGSPNGGGSQQGQQPNGQSQSQPNGEGQQQQGQQQQPNTPEFKVPDAYKDKPWSSKIKSSDDLWKQLENTQSLIGQKTIQPIDYTKATPEEIKAHHAKTAPSDMSAYKFAVPDDPVSKAVGSAFMEAGINEHQGQAVIKALAPFFEKMDGDIKLQSTSEEGYMSLAQKAFGDNYKETIGKAEKLLKEVAPNDEVKKALDDMPNEQRIVLDQMVAAMAEKYEGRIAKILKDHGIHESGAQGEGGQGKVTVDLKAQQKELRNQIRELDKKPHPAAEKKALIDKLNDTYKQA